MRDASSRFTAANQFVGVMLGLLFSIAYLWFTSTAWLRPYQQPGLRFYIVVGIVSLFAIFVINIHAIGEAIANLYYKAFYGRPYRQRWIRADIDYRIQSTTRTLYTLFMVVTLAYATLYTGGPSQSPYTQLLLGSIVLAPIISNSRRAGLGISALGLATYIFFIVSPPGEVVTGSIPIWLTVTTNCMAVGIATWIAFLQHKGL